MITLALAMVQAPTALTFQQLQTMAPAAAGEAILQDQPHAPIETFEVHTGGMMPPNSIEAQLVERPVAGRSGCVRRRWMVRFQAPLSTGIASALPDVSYSTQEIAPSSKGRCPADQYVRLAPGMSLNQGWDALARLNDVSNRVRYPHLQCSDSTASNLCKGDKAVRLTLSKLQPWSIVQDSSDIRIWMGVPGDIVTEVCFNLAKPGEVIVTREMPAPF